MKKLFKRFFQKRSKITTTDSFRAFVRNERALGGLMYGEYISFVGPSPTPMADKFDKPVILEPVRNLEFIQVIPKRNINHSNIQSELRGRYYPDESLFR